MLNGPLDKNIQFSQFALGSGTVQTGNPLIDMALAMLVGNRFSPMPGQGQSILDSYLMRERSRDYMSLMRKGFGSSMMAQHLGGVSGINTDGFMGGMLAMGAGMTGLMDNSLIQGMNGGNPVRALMGLKANMTGMTMGQGFGRVTNADNDTVWAAYKGMQDQLFHTRTITANDLAAQQKEQNAKLFGNMSQASRNRLGKYISGADSTSSFDYDAFSKDVENQTGKWQPRIDELNKIEKRTKEETAELEKLQKIKDDYFKDTEEAIAATDHVMGFRGKIGQKMLTHTDQEFLRGYHIQDFTKAQTMALDLGMTSISKSLRDDSSVSLKDKAGIAGANFARHAGGALRAVSDFTGAETADEAMQQLNMLMGNSKVNLGTDEGAKEAEQLVRRFKASARSAGIGIDAVMGILNEVKELSAAHPELRYSGGLGALETSMKSLNATSALTASMGGDWTRQQGGQANVSHMMTQIHAEARMDDATKEIKGIVGLLAGDSRLDAIGPDGKPKREMLMNELSKWSQGDASIFGPAGHGMNISDKAHMMKVLSDHSGISQRQIGLARFSTSSVTAGQLYADANKQYNFDAAGEYVRPYSDYFTTLQGQLAGMGGLSHDEIKSVMRDVRQDFMDSDKTGLTPQQILAKTRRIKKDGVEKSFNLSGDPGSLLEKFTNDPKMMMQVLLGIKMQDPAFSVERKRQAIARDGQASEESRIAKQMAHLNSPFQDTLLQAWLGGSFGKGTEEMLSLISTPAARQRAQEQMDALQAGMALPSASTFRDLMIDTLGGKAGSSDADVTKNLGLLGVTDSASISKKLSQRKAWMTDKAGFTAFYKGVSNKDMNAIQTALKLSKDGKLNDDTLKGLGLTREELKAAGAFMANAGLTDPAIMSRFGGYSGADLQKFMPMSTVLMQSSQLAYQEAVDKTVNTKGTELSSYYQSVEGTDGAGKAHEQLALLADAGYLIRKKGRTGNTFDDFDWGNRSGLSKYISDFDRSSDSSTGKLNSLFLSGGDIKKNIGNLDGSEISYLQNYGALRYDKDGNASWDDDKLSQLSKVRKGLAAASQNSIFTSLGSNLSEAKRSLELHQTRADDRLTAERLKEMTSALGSGAGALTEALNKISALMTSALNK